MLQHPAPEVTRAETTEHRDNKHPASAGQEKENNKYDYSI